MLGFGGFSRSETMNKPGNAGAQGGGVGNFGPGGVAGPTAAAAAQAAQRQRSLLQRADADIGSLLDNFSHLLKAARVSGRFPPWFWLNLNPISGRFPPWFWRNLNPIRLILVAAFFFPGGESLGLWWNPYKKLHIFFLSEVLGEPQNRSTVRTSNLTLVVLARFTQFDSATDRFWLLSAVERL